MRKRRERMEPVDALGDRRCRTQMALAKLAQLRHRLQRFTHVGETRKKLCSPTLENALTFLGYPFNAGQLAYDCRYSKTPGMPVTGGRQL